MKNLILIILIVLTSGCEKVIELDTDFKDKRLVVDASISKHRDSINGTAVIKLSETIPYFSEEINNVENAQVSILVNNDIIDEISNIVNPTTFYDPAHIKIYEVIESKQ